MRLLVTLAVALCAFSGCHRANQSQEAIRQGVIDYVSSKVNVGAMDVNVVSIDFKGKEADALVEFKAKGSQANSGLQMRYTLEQQSGKWVVKDKAQAGGTPHGSVAPGAGGGSGELPAGHPPLDSGGGKP